MTSQNHRNASQIYLQTLRINLILDSGLAGGKMGSAMNRGRSNPYYLRVMLSRVPLVRSDQTELALGRG